MHMSALLHAILVQAASPDAGGGYTVDDLFKIITGTTGILLLGMLWKISAYHTATAARFERIEGLLFGDGKGNEGCAIKHRALDKLISDAPSRGSVNEAFQQVRALEKTAAEDRAEFAKVLAEDRQSFKVALAELKGMVMTMTEKFDGLTREVELMARGDEGDVRRPLARTKTNPGFKP